MHTNTLSLQLQGLVKRIFHSPVLTDDLADLCHAKGIKAKKVVRCVPTRWNSVTMMLKRAVYLRKALDKLVVQPRHNTSRSAQLERFKLSNAEWDVLLQLLPILEVRRSILGCPFRFADRPLSSRSSRRPSGCPSRAVHYSMKSSK